MDSNRRALAVYLAINIESQQPGQPFPVARTIPLFSLLWLLEISYALIDTLERVTGLWACLEANLLAFLEPVIVTGKLLTIIFSAARFVAVGV